MNAFTQAELLRALPQARRFARAITGEQTRGDALVAEAIGAGLPTELPARLALYAAIVRRAPPPPGDQPQLTPLQRQLLLLTALEDLSIPDAGRVLGLDEPE
ncbi:MAG TPA: response regulator, partial [Roseomonas sp.]